MKLNLLLLIIVAIPLSIFSQIVIPNTVYKGINWNNFNITDLPKSNREISFSPYRPYLMSKDPAENKNTTDHFLITISKIKDSLLSECINFAMLSYEFEHAYHSISNGSELWYGEIQGGIEVYSGIYYKCFSDSDIVPNLVEI